MTTHSFWKRALGGAAIAVTLAIANVASAAPVNEPGVGLPRDASKYGHHIDWLLKITMAFTAFLFVVMCIWMVLAFVKHGRKHTAEYDHGDDKSSVKHALVLSAVIFFIVDGNLWVDSTLDVNRIFWNYELAEKHPEAVRVEVNAHQWAWDFRYAGADDKFDSADACLVGVADRCDTDEERAAKKYTSADQCLTEERAQCEAYRSTDDVIALNELVVPVDTPVILQLASTDVIHSFYLPNMRVKMDATPGMVNHLWFHPKDVGDYDIGCAQHCGMAHYKMKGMLRVLSKEDYAVWKKEAEAAAQRYYTKDDATGHWGWAWREI